MAADLGVTYVGMSIVEKGGELYSKTHVDINPEPPLAHRRLPHEETILGRGFRIWELRFQTHWAQLPCECAAGCHIWTAA